MRRPGKPTEVPSTPFASPPSPVHAESGWIWAPLRQAWLPATPEERVRQEFIYRLHAQWGFALDQMAQERRTQSGRGSPRVDIVVCESAEALRANRDYRIAVETKAENVKIQPADYAQGESYARAVQAEFLVLHNDKETAFFRLVPGAPGERIEITSIPKADDFGDARRLAAVRSATKAFTRDEFQRVLFECHCILRDNHKMDPGAAFDEISKILFIKMAFERLGTSEVFTTDRINSLAGSYLANPDGPELLQQLFDVTKTHYRTDELFAGNESLRVSMASFRRIVKLLERFNLSDTGDDVKGLAFERFLGQTFRGELGQFFTPRPVVEFVVEFLDPIEGDLICDPAAGTGGFLIKTFEHLREKIECDIEDQKDRLRRSLTRKAKAEKWDDETFNTYLDEGLRKLNSELDVTNPQSRLYRVAHESIFGVDAEQRAARTSKMNMIMHGDGHGGIYYHDGLLDTHEIFAGRFDIVMTNPPFGASVADDQIVGATEQTKVELPIRLVEEYQKQFGHEWVESYQNLKTAAATRRPVLELFDIGRDPIGGPVGSSRVRRSRTTEMLFVERCLNLLRPGGRMGIVLPDGILNNPSVQWLRDYVQGRARILAVVSLPREVFASAKATVKTSLVFLRRFTVEDERAYAQARDEAHREADGSLVDLDRDIELLRRRVDTYDRPDLGLLTRRIDELVDGAVQGRDVQALRDAEAELRRALTPGDRERARALSRELQALVARRRELHAELVNKGVRARFDYPVLMAEAAAAGITSTGDTGPDVPNDLPLVLEFYREHRGDLSGA